MFWLTEGLLALADLTTAAGRGARYLAREGRQLLWFWRGALILGISTVHRWIVLAGGSAGLGFSKDGGPEPCGTLKRGCCYAWAQELEVCVPAQGTVPLCLAGGNPCLLPARLKGAPASRAEWDVPPKGTCCHACAGACFAVSVLM